MKPLSLLFLTVQTALFVLVVMSVANADGLAKLPIQRNGRDACVAAAIGDGRWATG